MEKYRINNSNVSGGNKDYNLFSNNSYNINNDYNFFEFYFNTAHLLLDGTTINIRNNNGVNIGLDVIISLRKQVKISINANKMLRWRYIDNSNDWQDIGIVSTTLNQNIPLPSYEEIDNFSLYNIDYQINSGIVQVKETHSNIWQNLIFVSDIDNFTNSNTLTFSTNSNIKTIDLLDTYLRINQFDLYIKIPIIQRGYSDDRSQYIFTTNYLFYNNKFVTTLQDNDELWVTINPITTNDLIRVPNSDSLENEFWQNQDWFNPNSISSIQSNVTYVVMAGTVTYMGIVYNVNDTFVGIDNNSVFDSFSSDAVVYVVNNPDGLYWVSIINEDIVVPDIRLPITISVQQPCFGVDSFYFFQIISELEYLPEDINEIYKKIDLGSIVFWKEFGGFKIEFNISTNYSINILQSDLVETKFFDVEREKAINPIFDSERIRFEPYYITQNGSGDNIYNKINCINYRLTFRDCKESNNNFNCSDYSISPSKWRTLGFTDEDVKYHKTRLRKTFLTLNYFNVQNPTVQLLEHYNTVFTDINMMYSEYISGTNNISGLNQLNKMQPFSNNLYDNGFNTSFYIYNPYISKIDMNSRSVNTTNSSEGYYIYLFGDEYKDSIPTELYMKLEFNNALSGKRTLFFNRISTSGVDLNNIFFDLNSSLNYVYVKFWVTYDNILDKFIYYPDLNYNNVSIDPNKPDIMIINMYEANVK